MASDLIVRGLALTVFVAGIAGATYVANDLYGPDGGLAGLEATPPAAPVVMLPGSTATATLGLQAVGDRALNVTASTDAPGFSASAIPARLGPGASGPLHVTIRASPDVAPGTHTLAVRLSDEAGVSLGVTKVIVTVSAARAPEITATPAVPAAMAGVRLEVAFEVANPLGLPQDVNVTLDGPGTVNPPRLSLGPLQRRVGTATIDVPADASGSLAVRLTATLAGTGLSSTAETTVPVAEAGALHVGALHESLIVRAGNTVAIPFVVVWAGDAAERLTVEGPADALASSVQGLAPHSATGVFVSYAVPASFASAAPVAFTFRLEDGPAATATVALSPPVTPPVHEGDSVQVDYVGRLDTGQVFDTSLPLVGRGPFAKSPTFGARPAGEYRPFDVGLSPQGGTIQGFWRAIVGMSVGETRTVRLDVDDAYGPKVLEERLSAVSTVQRAETGARSFPGIQRQLVENPQTGVSLEGLDVGDEFDLASPGGGLTYRFRIERIDDATVDLRWVLAVGQRFTFFDMWPDSTAVRSLNDTHVTFYTTPTATGPDARFTWRDARVHPHAPYWVNGTYVSEVTPDTIVLRHVPLEGSTYQVPSGFGGPPSAYTVRGVEGDEILVERVNPSPLAGETLTFDITVVRSVEGDDHQHG